MVTSKYEAMGVMKADPLVVDMLYQFEKNLKLHTTIGRNGRKVLGKMKKVVKGAEDERTLAVEMEALYSEIKILADKNTKLLNA